MISRHISEEKERFPALYEHYADAANFQKLTVDNINKRLTKSSKSDFSKGAESEDIRKSSLKRADSFRLTHKNMDAVRRAGHFFEEDHVGNEKAKRQVKDAYIRYLELRMAEGLAARGDALVARVNAERHQNTLIHYWDLLGMKPQNPY